MKVIHNIFSFVILVAFAILLTACPDPSLDFPEASFSIISTSFEIGDTINFKNTSHYAKTFNWNFGDGGSSSTENPFHIYKAEGEYTVRLLVSNGDGSDEASETIQINPYRCWTTLKDSHKGRGGPGGFLVAYNDRLFTFPQKFDITVEEYDPVSNSWTYKEPRSRMVGYYAASELNGKVYLIGGKNTSNVDQNTVDVYDLETNTWSVSPPLINPRFWASAVTFNNKIYVIGGAINWYPELYFYNTIEIYDPGTDTWTEKNCPIHQWTPAVAVVGEKIYVIGGHDETTPLSSVYEFDPLLEDWKLKSPMPTPRWGAACVVVNDSIYVMGGGGQYNFEATSTEDYNTIEVYLPNTDTWVTKTAMPVKRTLPVACWLNDKIYVNGGAVIISSSYTNFHAYDPSCDTH